LLWQPSKEIIGALYIVFGHQILDELNRCLLLKDNNFVDILAGGYHIRSINSGDRLTSILSFVIKISIDSDSYIPIERGVF
jgi:hypothetical protein